eukprot:scaffold34999_cov144-Skeletonema_dohrnii-CCMP3373.AAC.1
MPGVKIIERYAFYDCKALTDVECGKLEIIGKFAFKCCNSLRSINLLSAKIVENGAFTECTALKNVEFVLRDTIDALLLEEWRNDMKDKLGVIDQSLSNTPAGDVLFDVGGKALTVQLWIRSVLRTIVRYKSQHRSYVNEAATTLQSYLPNDIVFKNVFPFLELPSYTFEGEDMQRKRKRGDVQMH